MREKREEREVGRERGVTLIHIDNLHSLQTNLIQEKGKTELERKLGKLFVFQEYFSQYYSARKEVFSLGGWSFFGNNLKRRTRG